MKYLPRKTDKLLNLKKTLVRLKTNIALRKGRTESSIRLRKTFRKGVRLIENIVN